MSLSKPVKITISVLLAVIIGLGLLWYFSQSDEKVDSGDSINYGPPTETELSETNQHKQSLVEGLNEDEEMNNSEAKRKVVPIISYWGQNPENSNVEVNGYVPNVIEKNGNCTARLVKDDKTVEKSKIALDDAQTTSCGLIVIEKAKITTGDWLLTLSYDSPSSTGSSETVTVKVD